MDSEPAATNAPVQPMVMLPCPFCGSDNCHVMEKPGTPRLWVECLDCGSSGPDVHSWEGAEQAWNGRDWQGMTKQVSAVGFLQGVLQGLRIGIDDERAKIIDSALSDERYFAT